MNTTLAIPTPDPSAAFETFLQRSVANGEAAASTITAYRREMAAFVAWCNASGRDPMQATIDTVEAYREALKLAGAKTSTIQHKLTAVRVFYSSAVRHNLMPSNPAIGVRAGNDRTEDHEKIKATSAQVMRQIVATIPGDTLKGHRDRALLALMFMHGLRASEVCGLDVSPVRETMAAEEWPLRVFGKGSKWRTVHLTNATVVVLEGYLESRVDDGTLPGDGPLFTSLSGNSHGRRLSRFGLCAIVNAYMSAVGSKERGKSCHSLRHGHAVAALKGGANLEQIGEEMGHKSRNTTLKYARVVDRAKAENNPSNAIPVQF